MSEIPSPTVPPELLTTSDGGPHRPHHVLNHLADWLEPRWLDPATADLIQHLYETALEHLDNTDRDQLSPAARRWTRETHWHRPQPPLPFDNPPVAVPR